MLIPVRQLRVKKLENPRARRRLQLVDNDVYIAFAWFIKKNKNGNTYLLWPFITRCEPCNCQATPQRLRIRTFISAGEVLAADRRDEKVRENMLLFAVVLTQSANCVRRLLTVGS